MAIGDRLAGAADVANCAGAAPLSWRTAALTAAGLSAVILAVYTETLASLVDVWTISNLYSHGFLVVPAAGFLLWRRRERLRDLPPTPSLAGPVLLALFAVAWLFGAAASLNLVEHAALVAMLAAGFVTVFGLRIARAAALPLGFLAFAVPVGGELVPALQDLTGRAVAALLVVTGIPAHLDGDVLSVPAGRFEIAEACAGARFLIASLAAAVFGADLLFARLGKRFAFVGFAAVLAIAANAVRAYLIVAIADWRGLAAGIAFDHVTFGLVFLATVLLVLFAIGLALRDGAPLPPVEPAAERGGASAPSARATGLIVVAALVAVIVPNLAARLTAPEVPAGAVALRPPDAADPWRAAPPADPWHLGIANADAEFVQRYAAPAGAVTLHVAYFAQQRQGAEAVQEGNRYFGAAPWREIAGADLRLRLAGQTLRVPCAVVSDGAAQRLACFFFWVDGRATGSALTAKLYQAMARLSGGAPAAAVIGFMVDPPADGAAAADIANDLFAAVPPLAQWLRNAADHR